jgi:hypothetical protein
VRALCEAVAVLIVLLSKTMTCARLHCNATPSEHLLHTSDIFRLHSSPPHFTLRTSTTHSTLHLISPHLQLFSSFAHRSLRQHRKHLHMRSFYTRHAFSQKFLHREFFHTEVSTHSKLLLREAFMRSKSLANFYIQAAFTHRVLLHTASVYTQPSFTQIYTNKLFHTSNLHTARVYTEKLLHIANFYTEKLLHREASLHREAFEDRCVYTRKILHRETFTHRSSYAQNLFRSSLRKTFPTTTLHHKACANHFQVLLCTTKLAPSTSLYYFVLQSLHRILPSTTLYYKVCAVWQAAT